MTMNPNGIGHPTPPDDPTSEEFDAGKFGRWRMPTDFFKKIITTPLAEAEEKDLVKDTIPPYGTKQVVPGAPHRMTGNSQPTQRIFLSPEETKALGGDHKRRGLWLLCVLLGTFLVGLLLAQQRGSATTGLDDRSGAAARRDATVAGSSLDPETAGPSAVPHVLNKPPGDIDGNDDEPTPQENHAALNTASSAPQSSEQPSKASPSSGIEVRPQSKPEDQKQPAHPAKLDARPPDAETNQPDAPSARPATGVSAAAPNNASVAQSPFEPR